MDLSNLSPAPGSKKNRKRVEKTINGRLKIAWVQIQNTNNEPLDLRVYATAAKDLLNINWSALESHTNGDPMTIDPPAQEVMAPPHSRSRRPRRGGPSNWVTSW